MNNWNKKIVIKIAKNEKINLNNHHWDIIYFVRNLYKEYNIIPSVNIIIYFFNKKNNNNLDLNFFNIIFKNKFDKIIYKISGIPYPNKCLL